MMIGSSSKQTLHLSISNNHQAINYNEKTTQHKKESITEKNNSNNVYYLPSISPKIYYILLSFISFSLLISLPIMASTFKNQIESELQQQKTILIEQQFALQLNHMKNIDGIYLGRRKKLF